jgi:hypothetical protein
MGRHQHAGRADPALRRAACVKRRLQFRPERIGGEPFYRLYRTAIGLADGGDARARGVAINTYRTRAAITGVAANFCALELQAIAQHIGQALGGVYVDFLPNPIDCKRNHA